MRSVAGVRGQAISIGPGNDRVVAGGLAIGGSRERTVSLWAKTTASGLVTVATFGSNAAGGKWDIDIDGTAGGTLELGVGSGRTNGQGPRVNDGQWHMLTTVLPTGATNLSGVRFFVDGSFAYTGSGNRAIATAGGDFILGHAANAAWFQQFTGDIDEVVLVGVQIPIGIALRISGSDPRVERQTWPTLGFDGVIHHHHLAVLLQNKDQPVRTGDADRALIDFFLPHRQQPLARERLLDQNRYEF